MIPASALIVALFTSGAFAALPDTVDFRTAPAFLRLEATAEQRATAARLLRTACPDRVAHDAAEAETSKLAEKREALRAELHRTMPKMKPGAAYAQVFRQKQDADPRFAALEEEIERLEATNRERMKALATCGRQADLGGADLLIPLYEDAALSRPVGELRIKPALEPTDVAVLAYRVGRDGPWRPYAGDYVPGGEWGYTYQTVLEKRGDAVELPRRPFTTPVWLNFAKAFGHRLGEPADAVGPHFVTGHPSTAKPTPVLRFKSGAGTAAPVENDFVVERIEAGQVVLRESDGTIKPADAAWDDAHVVRLRKRGRERRAPLRYFFDKDEHVIVVPVAGC